MTINNKFLLSTVCALSLMSSMPAWADETEEEEDDGWVSVVDETKPAVLFKIHDIKPIRNREGKITNCEFGATFYNRSEDGVKNINMDLTWEDKAIEDVIDMEKKVAKKKMENDYYNSEAMGTLSEPDSETEKYTRKVLTTTLKVPNLQPYRQVSLKSRIRSDRCFLMVNDVKFKFTSCDVSGKEEKNLTSRSMGNAKMAACSSLFKFVNAKDPEYYREFKKVSFNEEKKAKVNARKQEQENLTKAYNQTVSNLARATDIMGQIR